MRSHDNLMETGSVLINRILTFGLIVTAFLLASVGSGWQGSFKYGFLKISIHNLKNLEMALWCMLIFKATILYFLRAKEEKKEEREGFKLKISRKGMLGASLVILILLIILYKNTMQGYFLNDDCLILRDVKKGFYNSVLLMPEFAHKYGVIRPLTFFTWFIDYKLFSIKPLGWYLNNFFLQIIAIFFVFLLANKITRDKLIALTVSALFGLSPLHHEVMNWIAARADLVCGMFFFASLYFYLIFRENTKKDIFLGISLISFVFALLSKETALSLPLVIIIMEILLARDLKQFKKSWNLFAAYFAVLALYLLMRYLTFGTLHPGPAVGGAAKILLENVPEYIKGAFLGLFVPMFFPVNWFSVEYFRLPWIQYVSFLNAFVLYLLIVFNLKKIINTKVLIFSILFIISGSALLLNIWEIGKSLHASRYYYFISFGFYLFIATLCLKGNTSVKQEKLNLSGLCFIFLCNIIFSSVNNLAWENAGKIPLKIINQAKNIYSEKVLKTLGTLYFYGLPKYVAGVVVYSIEPEVITEQLSHFYKIAPLAVLVRPRGIMLDLNKVDFSKDKILQWNANEERLYDISAALKGIIKKPKPNVNLTEKALRNINDIYLWERTEQVINLKEKGRFDIQGRDGFFFSQEISLPARTLPYLSIKMKVNPKSRKYLAGAYSGRLYWKTDKNPEFDDERFFEFWLNPKDEFTEYKLYFITPKEVLGNEFITQLKLLPAYFPCNLEIDSIKLIVKK